MDRSPSSDTSDTSANGADDPAWVRLALAVAIAVTMVRVLVVAASPIPLFFDEAQYWSWAQDFAFGYYSKPPVIAWAIATTTSVCGDGAGCVRLSAPLVHGATAFVMFFIARHFYNARIGFWTTAIYAVLPGVSLSAVIVSTDVFLLFFWALAFLSLIRAESSNTVSWWIVFGLVLGFGLLSKYAMVFFLFCMVADSLWRQQDVSYWRRQPLWGSLTLAALIYAPNLIWNWTNDFPSYRHTGENMNLGGDLFNPLSALEFIGAQFAVFGPILLAAFFWLTWHRFRSGATRSAMDDKERRLWAFSLPILVLITVEAFLSRSHANWAAVSYITASVLVTGELLRLSKDLWLKVSVALHVGVALLLYNFDLIVRTLDLPLTPDLDPARRMRGWDRAGEWASDLRRDFPNVRLLFDDRKVMAEMLYYTRPHPFESVMWNPKNQRNNHYEMTTDLSGSIGEDFLYIIKHDWPDRAAASFAGSNLIATFRSRAYTGDALELRAYMLEDFQGYQR